MGLDLDFTYPIHVDLAISIRLVIGFILLAAGIFKLRRRNQTYQFIKGVGFPAGTVGPVYLLTVALEVSTGVLLIAGFTGAAIVASLLFASFVVALIRTRTSDEPCACLGAGDSTRSLLVRLLPRFAGLAGSVVILFLPHVGRAPSLVSILIASIPLAWVLRPRRSRVEIGKASEDEEETPDEDIGAMSGLGAVTREHRLEGRHALSDGHSGLSRMSPVGVNRRTALQRAVGVAAVGALAPVNRFGNLLGFSCCVPDPCPAQHYCDDRSPFSGCHCVPRPAKPAVDEAIETYEEVFAPQPVPPPCNCRCHYDECMEAYGYPSGWDCLGQCGFACTKVDKACAAAALNYAYCMANCVSGPTFQEALICASEMLECCAEHPKDPSCKEPGLFGSQFALGPGLVVPDDLALWRARALIVSGLYRESAVSTVLDLVGMSSQFHTLRPDQQALVLSDLNDRAQQHLELAEQQRKMVTDRFIRAAIGRNVRLAGHALATSRELGQRDVVLPKSSPSQALRGETKPIKRSSEHSPTASSWAPIWRTGVEACLKDLATRRKTASVLEVPQGSLPLTLASEWERDLRRIQRVTRWHAARSAATDFRANRTR